MSNYTIKRELEHATRVRRNPVLFKSSSIFQRFD